MDSFPHALLVDAWFCILALMAACYVVSDGFDLGIGILSLFAPDRPTREAMLGAIVHVRDANETWLVVIGGGLFGAFPAAYAMLLPQLYVPLITMVLGLILRGAAVEMRGTAPETGAPGMIAPGAPRHTRLSRPALDRMLGVGSLVAAVSQGAILGRILTGLRPGAWHGVLVVAAVIGVGAGYALLGSTYLLGRSAPEVDVGIDVGIDAGVDARVEGLVAAHARRWTLSALWLAVSSAVLLTADLMSHHLEADHLHAIHGLPLLPLGCGAIAAAVALFLARRIAWSRQQSQGGPRREPDGSPRAPFGLAVLLTLVSLAGLASSVFPYIVPGRLMLAEASSNDRVLALMLAGVGVLLPIMVAYTLYRNLRSMARPSAGHVL
ncbi:cytochrome d ubiquinol oxidase subunit II [Cupriavidus plantarum]|uniref:cytochrome d ubiquinol oxidase subunit II n=2 Tax=Cupriavidus plantarum TaxID=942865 RepID=UPI00339D4EC0